MGCGSGQGEVSGVVKFKGEPLPSGRVTFHPEDKAGAPASGLIKEDGSYTISKCPVGPVAITVETFRRGGEAQVPKGLGIQPPSGAEGGGGKYVAIPPKYSSPELSGLTYTVTKGKQEHPINLEP